MNHTTLTMTLKLQSTRKLRMTRKILITLCTLLAVGSGHYMYAPPPVKVETGKTEVKGTGRSGTAGKLETGPSEGQKSEASSGAKKQTMTYTDGKPTPDKFDVASSFNLDMSQGDGTLSAPQAGKRGSGETIHTLTRNDGSLYKIKIDKDGNVLSKQSRKNGTDNVGVDYDPAMRDSKGNPLTIQEAFQARRTQAQQATPEAKATARTEVETKVSEAKAENPQAAKAARGKADAAKEKAPERKADVDTASKAISTALESGNEGAVNTAVAELAEKVLPSDVSPEQKGNFVTRLTAKIMEMGKQGLESIKSTINNFIESLFSRPETESRLSASVFTPIDGPENGYSSYAESKAAVDARDSGEPDTTGLFNNESSSLTDISRPSTPVKTGTGGRLRAEAIKAPEASGSRSASPTGVAEAPDIFAPKPVGGKPSASAGAEPSTRIQNGVYTPAKPVTSSLLLNVN